MTNPSLNPKTYVPGAFVSGEIYRKPSRPHESRALVLHVHALKTWAGIVSVRSIHEDLFKLSVFFKFSYLVAKMGVGHRHGDAYFYHILVTKISPPRVTGYMLPSGHWRFRGTMAPSRSEQAAPLAAGHPATTSGNDGGMYPVTRGGLIRVRVILVTKT